MSARRFKKKTDHIEMPQTKEGVHQNPWLAYMKVCAENYKAGNAPPAAGKDPPEVAPPTRRAKGKQTPAKPITKKDEQELVKSAGKARAKEKEKAKPITKKDEQELVKSAGKARAKVKEKAKPITKKDEQALQKVIKSAEKARAKAKAKAK